VHIHGRPDRNLYSLEYLGQEDDPRLVLLVFDRDRDRSRDQAQARVFPSSLRSGVVYRVGGSGQLVTAETARSAGIVVPFAWAPDADVIVLEPVG
jgi:alpha-galactosidase